jgi:ABC-type sugar transport system ATPase subunit
MPDVPVPIIETHNLWRRFGGLVALNDVAFQLWPGEIVGLVGDNGAGKSTLIKILSGDLQPSAGSVCVDGVPVHFRHPLDAKNMRIETIYQDLALCENLSVMDNVFLGREELAGGILRLLKRRQMHGETRQLLDTLGISIPSTSELVVNLSGGQRQGTALARVFKSGARVVIFDEPTAALGVNETRHLLDLILRFKAEGISMIVISHEMRDIFGVTDRIVVLKRGEVVGDKLTRETDPDEIVRLIIRGRE